MESPLGLSTVHWDHEPDRTNLCNNCYNNLLYSTAVHGKLNLLSNDAVRCDREPLITIVLNKSDGPVEREGIPQRLLRNGEAFALGHGSLGDC